MIEFAMTFTFWTSAVGGVVTILFWSAFTYLLFMGALYIRSKIKRRK